MKEQKIKVLALLPMELPKEIELDNTLEAMQKFVGGLIECITFGLHVRTVHPFVLPPICSYCASIHSISCFISCTSVSGAVTLTLLP